MHHSRVLGAGLSILAGLMSSACASDNDPIVQSKGIAGASANGVAGASANGVAGASANGVAGASANGVAGASANGVAGASANGVAGASANAGTQNVGGQAHVASADPLGVYVDDYAGSHHIDSKTWTMGTDVFEFSHFDAEHDQAVAKNGASNQFNAGRFSRFDWATDASGRLRYCQVVYNADSAAAAAEPSRADEGDWGKGCGGFAWSILSGPSIVGSYVDDFGGGHEITGATWAMSGQAAAAFELRLLSNAGRYLVAQNSATNSFNPGKFSRFDWARGADQAFYYCQTVYNAETQAAALAATAADSTNLQAGCGGFSWSKLTAKAR